jgi:alpha-glucuronidase
MFARSLKKHGDGIVMYRAFVYNHHLDENDPKNDRANAAVEYFADLDTQFDDNVIVQVKFGPIDFQIREPPSPLIAHLKQTGMMMEFMVCQEYLGQQSHYVYQAPLWKTILDFDMRIDGKESVIGRDILSGKTRNWNRCGYAAVVNIGNDTTWLGHHLSMSNLYGYGRLTWNPREDAEALLQDWTRLTFGTNKTVVDTITKLGMETWPTYESYSGNLGVQTLCDIIYTHYGPSPASQDGNGWGQWTRADAHGIGMDRTTAGTGNAAQYPAEVAKIFENIETTPDDLLLWFHHVPYTHRLKSGKTVIQHFYDEHYEGAAGAQTFPVQWAALKGLIDDARYEHVAFKLRYQAGHAIVWRDSVNGFYRTKSGIEDEKNRVGNHRWRVEAQDMTLSGYSVVSVTPPEAASGGSAIVASSKSTPGEAVKVLEFDAGVYNVAVNYYDHSGGTSQYQLFIGERLVGEWKGNLGEYLGHDFSDHLDGHSATRVTFNAVKIEKGDVLKILGTPDGAEMAPLDYVSVLPEGVID